ncbi:MAG TPA: sigma-54 dependent transcriptional regulator [Rhodanobacteraceae bacterium]|nr:sigma-54 dependent transcriptional regulator [Rhodanobacteraceae bacterium]
MPANAAAGNVLVVDDNLDFQALVSEFAKLSRCRVTSATTLHAARQLTADDAFDLLMVDLDLPDGNGLDLIDDIDLTLHGEIAIVTGNPTIETATRAVRSPVVEYLTKPIGVDALGKLIERAQLRAQTRRLPAREFGGMVGQTPAMRDLFESIRRVAPLDVCVLVYGESGTGKELVARSLHEQSGRRGRFVAVNCGAIAADLLSSQLFGHERGSFTGALQSHAGFFEQAEGGTLFLDEITEMPLAAQVYLLRVLESRTLTRVGGAREIAVDVRIVAGTNRDPQRAVADGALRADLYYRLLEFPLSVPTLRERREDIPTLAQYFLDRLNERYRTSRTFAPGALRVLAERHWPGNVRELRHAIQRHYILGDGPIEIAPEPALRPVDDADGVVRFRVGMTFDDIEREMLLKTLAHYGNNKRHTARALGITTKTIYNRLLRYRSQGLIDDTQVGAPPDDSEGD